MERKEQGRREQERMMMKRLYEASVSGSLTSLIQLIEEVQLILDRVMIITYFNETPLHIAAMLGHLEFAREILRCKPELAAELDSKSSSPLHLASAKGKLAMVKELLRINPDVCCVIDSDGRTPLHLAVIKGRIDVIKELIQAQPEVIHMKVFDKGESILHLCVRYNRLEALKLLLESTSDQELLNSKDDEGNTALHLAIAKKQTKGIDLLLAKNGVEVNVLNESGLTALDILAQSPGDIKDMNISESLKAGGALRAKDIIGETVITRPNALMKTHTDTCMQPLDKYEWLERKKNSLMVVSTVITTMAFQAVLSPPGGVGQDDNGHKAGKSILADKNHELYTAFLIVNTLSFLGSLSITFLLISGLPLKRRFFMWILLVSMWVVITSLVATYIVSILQVTPDCLVDMLWGVMSISIGNWYGLVSLVLVLHTARWFFRSAHGLPLLQRIGMWTLALSCIIGSIVVVSKYFNTISIVVRIAFYVLCTLCGMAVPMLLLYTARFLKKCWKVSVKMVACLRVMMNDDSHQSSV